MHTIKTVTKRDEGRQLVVEAISIIGTLTVTASEEAGMWVHEEAARQLADIEVPGSGLFSTELMRIGGESVCFWICIENGYTKTESMDKKIRRWALVPTANRLDSNDIHVEYNKNAAERLDDTATLS